MNPYYKAMLSSTVIAIKFYGQGHVPSRQDLNRYPYLFLRSQQMYYPDHYYKGYRQRILDDDPSFQDLLLLCYKKIGEPLSLTDKRVTVQRECFSEWQNILTLLSPLPIIVYALFRDFREDAQVYLQNGILDRSLLPSIKHPLLSSLIRTEGLCESHLHLNGSTEIDYVWQTALRFPTELWRELTNGLSQEEVLEHYHQIDPDLDPNVLLSMFRQARVLRHYIATCLFDNNGQASPQETVQELLRGGYHQYQPVSSWHEHPVAYYCSDIHNDSDLCLEGVMWLHIFLALAKGPNVELARAVYAYQLFQASMVQFLVQQVTQKGFDQFQKITFNEGRRFTERSYYQRFKQLEGHYAQDLVFLEGRFAPKQSTEEMLKLLASIIGDFEVYQEDKKPLDDFLNSQFELKPNAKRIFRSDALSARKRRMQLRLVVHFIKREQDPDDRHFCRLRRKLNRSAEILISLKKRFPKIDHYLTGADAASNERHTPPEVFAPVFRKLRRHGWRHFTYHVGEDYDHLATGIRAVYEAVHFLDLRDGNRIGHGIAVGIDPHLWLERTATKMMVSKYDWMDTLVFIYFQIIQDSDHRFAPHAVRIRECALKLARQIFDCNMSFDMDLLYAAWQYRELDFFAVLHPQHEVDELEIKDRIEWVLAGEKKKEDRRAFELLEWYFINRGQVREQIEIETDFFDVELLRYLQDRVITLLNDRMVAIESIPTSNLRIAPYNDYHEHHLFRWLGLCGDGPSPTVVLGSDDPGIFASNLRNEFAHVLNVLVDHFGKSHEEAARYLRRLNRSAHAFRFDHSYQLNFDAPNYLDEWDSRL